MGAKDVLGKIGKVAGGASKAAGTAKNALGGANNDKGEGAGDAAARKMKNTANNAARAALNVVGKALVVFGGAVGKVVGAIIQKVDPKILVIALLLPIILLVGLIVVILSVFGAAVSLSTTVLDAGQQEGRPLDKVDPELAQLVEDALNSSEPDEDIRMQKVYLWMDDPKNMLKLVSCEDIAWDIDGMVGLDRDTTIRLFDAIVKYDEYREEEREITYTWREEIHDVVEYDDKGIEKHIIYDFPDIPDDLNTTSGYVPEDDEGKYPKNVKYDKENECTVKRKEVESYIYGNKDAFDVRWQPIYALAMIVARESWEDWDHRDIDWSEDMEEIDMQNYYLTDDQIQDIIDVFLYKSDYYYDIVNQSNPEKYDFRDFVNKKGSYKLLIPNESEDLRQTMRQPYSAPKRIYNKFVSFDYRYKYYKDEGEESTGEEAEVASEGSNVTVLGDSITYMCASSLSARLPQADILGEKGRTWQQGLDHVKEKKASGQLRDVVVFAYGTNNAGDAVNGVAQLTKADLDALAAEVGERKVILVLNYDSYDGYGKWWEQNNNVIRDYCSGKPNWKYLDWPSNVDSTALLSEPGGVHKGVHPTDHGIELWTEMVYDGVEEYLDDEIQNKTQYEVDFMTCYGRSYVIDPWAFRMACNDLIESEYEFNLDEYLAILETLPSTPEDRVFFGNDKFRYCFESGGVMEEYTEDPVVCPSIGVHFNPGKKTEMMFDPITGEVFYVPSSSVVVNTGDNARYLIDLLRQEGFTDVMIWAILGNLQAENGLTTAMSGHADSVGLAQWTQGRRQALYDHAAAMGMPPDSIEAQASYLVWELKNTETKFYTMCQGVTDIRTACDIFCIYFERPRYYSSEAAFYSKPNKESWDTDWGRYAYSDVDGLYHIDLNKRRDAAFAFASQFAAASAPTQGHYTE